MITPQQLAVIALVVAGGSSVFAAYAVLSVAPAPVAANACECDESGLRAELAALAGRVEVAERYLRKEDVPGGVASLPRVADGKESGAGETAVEDAVRPASGMHTVEIESPRPGVSVTQAPSGALSVRNTDPSLVGETLVVKVRGEDGTTRDVPITVPPVE